MPSTETGEPLRAGDAGGTLRLVAAEVTPAPGETVIVTDTAWTRGPGGAAGLLGIRDTVDAVFAALDPITETSTVLDAWARRSGIAEAMVVGETSIWFHRRLAVWLWLQERIIWAHLLERLIETHRPATIRLEAGAEAPLVDAASLLAAARGIALEGPAGGASDGADDDQAGGSADPDPSPAPAATRAAPASAQRPSSRGLVGRLLGRVRAPAPTKAETQVAAMTALLEGRVQALAAETGRPLLAVYTHHAQRIETPDGPRMRNPYLGTVVDRLRGTHLDPIVVEWRLKGSKAPVYAQLSGPGMERVVSQEATRLGDVADAARDAAWAAAATAARDRILAAGIPAVSAGIDFGPLLAAHVADMAYRWLPNQERWIGRIERFLRRVHVGGVLVADEYHQQDWMEAARRVDIPVFAVQHGTIYRQHRGYVHEDRPASLRLPARTYVYGRWERDILVEGSVYRPDEVVVSGSPRLDLDRARAADDTRAAVRAELGVADGDRLVVLSGTWGSIYRRFHYPAVLARLFDRPTPGVHLVVKQHPAEADEGPYRRVVEGVAAAGGFAPPPITVVRDVDLYRLLHAADAHLGVHSTVLTEAVVVGTPNLLAVSVAGGDLLDYVAAGVATPVANGAELLAGLRDLPVPDEETRRRFVEAHFEPGNSTERIAADILATVTR